MIVILIFMAGVAAIAFGWLFRQGIMSKPWLVQGVAGGGYSSGPSAQPTAKFGLYVFLAVAGGLFALFASAFFMRMEYPDWRPMPVPRLLWLNSGMLVLSSIALQCAAVAARRYDISTTRIALLTGAVSAVAFLAGQLAIWFQLEGRGGFVTLNPSISFFYLLTAVHGLHILGGLVALGRAMDSAWNGANAARLRVRVDLCAIYWHFLLIVWAGIFILLAGWANDFVNICRELLT
jgi:cytochrome c oxidase subunit 3